MYCSRCLQLGVASQGLSEPSFREPSARIWPMIVAAAAIEAAARGHPRGGRESLHKSRPHLAPHRPANTSSQADEADGRLRFRIIGLPCNSSPSRRLRVEIQHRCKHGVTDGVEQMCVAVHLLEATRRSGRRDAAPRLALFVRLQLCKIVEAYRFGRGTEVQQQHMSPLDRPFDAGNERDASVRCVSGERSHVELMIV